MLGLLMGGTTRGTAPPAAPGVRSMSRYSRRPRPERHRSSGRGPIGSDAMAAVDVERRAGDEARVRTREKGDGGRHLFRPAEAAKRRARLLDLGDVALGRVH